GGIAVAARRRLAALRPVDRLGRCVADQVSLPPPADVKTDGGGNRTRRGRGGTQNFKLPEDGEGERLRIVIGDGAEFVAASQKRYDLILVDGFDADARTGMLDSLPFYLNCKARLTPSGLMVTNLLSLRRKVRDSLDRISEAFDGRMLPFPPCASGNVVAFAAGETPVRCHIDALKTRAKTLKETSGLDLQATLTRLEASKSCPGGRVRF
ncbi:MAG: hypothetical protein Q8N33_05975, partial [Rhodocyclaceae bacterium]|nr:hypothetical protein [Rhodocyclaceae bacterium]